MSARRRPRPAHPGGASVARPAAVLAAVSAVVLVVGCAEADGDGDGGATAADAAASADDQDVEEQRGAYPRWEQVDVRDGDDAERFELLIAEDALEWRAAWSCDDDADGLLVEVTDTEQVTRTLTEADCPGEGESMSVETGALEVAVTAGAGWRIDVEQHVDSILEEPPLPEMQDGSAEVVARGSFAGVERDGAGDLEVYELADGRLAMRFEGFHTLASPDLEVWLSEATDVTTSAEAFDAPHVAIGELTSTFGHQNYVLPDDVTLDQLGSVVVWCVPMQIAYAAATVDPTPTVP